MILLVDLCYEKDSLSKYEFVYPIADALERAGAECQIRHYSEIDEESLDVYEGVVICGTALRDNTYAQHMESLSWVRRCRSAMLGICAGMQVIGLAFGGRIMPRSAIGLQRLEVIIKTPILGTPKEIEVYHLHNYGVTLPDGFLNVAGRDVEVEAFRHIDRPIYGILFHPEVRNKWILENFHKLCTQREA